MQYTSTNYRWLIVAVVTFLFDWCLVDWMLRGIAWAPLETVMFIVALLFLAVVELGILGVYLYLRKL